MIRTTTAHQRALLRAAAGLLALLLVAAPASAQFARGPSPLPERSVVVRLLPGGRLERSSDAGHSWRPVSGLPERVLPEGRAGEALPVTAFAVSPPPPDDPAARAALASSPGVKRLGYSVVQPGDPALAAVANRLFVSTDALASWNEVDLGETINRSAHITALAIDPADPSHWLAGTSYDGLYRTRDAGVSWSDLTADRDAWPIYSGAGFFEEIAALWFTAQGDVLLQAGFGQGFLRVELDPLSVARLRPLREGDESYDALARALGSPWSDGVAAPGRPEAGRANEAGAGGGSGADQTAAGAADRLVRAADRTGIYLSAKNAVREKLPGYFDYLDRHGFDSVVVDFKDDEGHVTYDSALELPRATGAVQPTIDPRFLVEEAAKHDIYVIARIVVFKDPMLWAYDDHRYALWDRRRDRPWGVFRTYMNEETGESRTAQVEHWVDPYSPEVWAYAIAIAREAEAFGVDEIQFDYIRFPSDGFTDDIRARYAADGADPTQALEGFLAAARQEIDIPIGIDVFGFNAWAQMSYLGQD
ncbi:MAG: putative glycoside hydrolase, partial [bacterium]